MKLKDIQPGQDYNLRHPNSRWAPDYTQVRVEGVGWYQYQRYEGDRAKAVKTKAESRTPYYGSSPRKGVAYREVLRGNRLHPPPGKKPYYAPAGWITAPWSEAKKERQKARENRKKQREESQKKSDYISTAREALNKRFGICSWARGNGVELYFDDFKKLMTLLEGKIVGYENGLELATKRARTDTESEAAELRKMKASIDKRLKELEGD